MKFKNINPLERHFEKAVILIALVVGAYFVYDSYVREPNAVDGIKPGQVEEHVNVDVKRLQGELDATHNFDIKPQSFVSEYKKSIQQPIPANLLAAVPQLGPGQLAIAIGPDIGIPTGNPIALPVVPALTDPQIASGRVVVSIPAPPAPRGGVQLPPTIVDKTYVQGKAMLPVADLVANVKAIGYAEFVHTAIYRIHVQRQEMQATGAWGPWTDVPPLAINPLPAFNPAAVKQTKDMLAQLDTIRKAYLSIIEPTYYKAAVLAPPPVPGGGGNVVPPAVPGHGATPRPVTPRPVQAPAQVPQPIVVPVAPLTPVVPAAQAAIDPTIGESIPDPSIAVWFWDDQIVPEHTYQYRARVEIINPLYKAPKGITTVPPGGDADPYLASLWTSFSPITIEADEYMYISRNNFGNNVESATFKIYKWHLGNWYVVEDEWKPGMTVGGTKHAAIVGQRAAPVDIDFGNAYTLVDVRQIRVPGQPDDLQAVLLNNSTGQLILRDQLTDNQDPQQRKLEESSSEKSAAVSAENSGGSASGSLIGERGQ